MAPPKVPALGATEAAVLDLYPSATRVPAKSDFSGRVLGVEDGDDSFHFVFIEDRLVHAVFNTRWSPNSSKEIYRKLEYFLNAYGGVDEFEITLDNGFGYTIERNDKAVFALYSYACDVFSVGPMHDGRIILHDWETRDEVA